MIESGELPGWALPKEYDGSVAIVEPVWVVTAMKPLILVEDQAMFTKASFLEKVLASAEAEGNA
jgi:hypothetical protein